ncbi:type II toxin-antitoxin system RelE/ParE family toxin [Roseivirga pacifica]|uniref:type II toxin-antitoxin system RelE/ParE family toxin n=1 Tax=Roseivirga pacifica TaxID=1267423 RepID=UPI003BAF660A
MRKLRKVIWSERALYALKSHHDRIALDSKSAAKKVTNQILKAASEIPPYAEKYQIDEYYPSNPGNIRRLFRWSFRIVYQINDDTIDILNVVHTSQEPNKNP